MKRTRGERTRMDITLFHKHKVITIKTQKDQTYNHTAAASNLRLSLVISDHLRLLYINMTVISYTFLYLRLSSTISYHVSIKVSQTE